MSLKKQGSIDFQGIEKELDYLHKNQVAVGFFGDRDSRLLTIVRANEYGAHIVPKKAQHLWIPTKHAIQKYGKTVRARDVSGIFIPKNKHVACVMEGGQPVVYFYLLDESNIPARPFLRKSLEENQKKYGCMAKDGIEAILYHDAKGKAVLEKIGVTAVSDIRRTMVRWTNPGNAPLTVDNKKGQDNPLIDTGILPKRVTWKIIPIGGRDE